MAVNPTTPDYCCLRLQQSLDLIAGDLAPDNITERMGFIGALTSDENTTGFQAIETQFFGGKARPVAGQIPKIEIMYEKPTCEDTVSGEIPSMCEDTNVDADTMGYLEVTVNECEHLSGSFTKDDFVRLCERPQERLAKQIRKKARDLIRKMDKLLIEKAYALMGLYSDGTPSVGATAKTINILNGEGHINPAGMAVIKSQFRKMHTDRLPIVVGGDILATWEETRIMAGMGDNAIGASVGSQLGGVSLYIDYHLDPVVQGLEADSASHALAWVPGSLQLVEWYKYEDVWEELGKEDYTQTTITIDGIRFDYHLFYDKCDHVWKYALGKCFDLFYIPDQVYQPCWDFNHKLHFELGCGTWDCASYLAG